jgi:CRISPR-associated endonuclease/helicase Cas3
VGELAHTFAQGTPWKDEACLAGLLHDLGKYGDRFQARLQGHDQGLDHWSQGAWLALTEHRAIAAALSIQGHHVGLQRADRNSLQQLDPARLVENHPFQLNLSDPDISRLKQRANVDGINFLTPANSAIKSMAHAVGAMLDVRLVFSCLADADFLDTENHFIRNAPNKQFREPGPKLNAQTALLALERYLHQRIRGTVQADAKVIAARETLWQSAAKAARAKPNIFTLTAPTGAGKTLAMLRFALEHAATNSFKRIVLVVPFLTVIEQTARIYRHVFEGFPENFVLEHHSLAGLGEEHEKRDAEAGQERQRRLLSENWDAPIVLTTNVQLLESLFSNRPSTCRKLHNLMDSVILFDEAQTMPQNLAVPTLAALSHLSVAYHSSVVFATATQPAFDTLHEAVAKQAASGWRPVEIVPEHAVLFSNLKRVDVSWPRAGERQNWTDLAGKLRETLQALVVVNLKRHALTLLEALGDAPDVFHLSTNLCAMHRRTVLDKVRELLKAGQPCRLISTQCVEAGVDVDFPKVFRALGPLEAIAQAAGRCNREGRMNINGNFGKVIVFEPEETGSWRQCYPTHAYFQATEVTRVMLARRGELDINDPAIFRDYYRRLYDLNNPAGMNVDLNDAIQARDFVEVARGYRIINQAAIQVLVPWAERQDLFFSLRNEAQESGISSSWIRRAQGLAVSVYRARDGYPPAWAIPAKLRHGTHSNHGVSDEWFILEGSFYDGTLGLKPPEGPQTFIA